MVVGVPSGETAAPGTMMASAVEEVVALLPVAPAMFVDALAFVVDVPFAPDVLAPADAFALFALGAPSDVLVAFALETPVVALFALDADALITALASFDMRSFVLNQTYALMATNITAATNTTANNAFKIARKMRIGVLIMLPTIDIKFFCSP